MNRQGWLLLITLTGISMLSACMGGIWTGASLFYDRHNVIKKVDNYTLAFNAHQIIFDDKQLNCKYCNLDLAVFNGDILLAGHVPTQTLRDLAAQRLRSVPDYRRVFVQIAVRPDLSEVSNDSWITTKIRSRILADSDIDPNQFKIVTVDGIVYIMGDVRPKQALRVISIARKTSGVKRVVKLLRYFNLSEKPSSSG